MRWDSSGKKAAEPGERIRRKFLFFPMEIDGEVRWLERARWLEEWRGKGAFPLWRKVKWLDGTHQV